MSSTAATSDQPIPARASAFSAASTGAKPKSCGASAWVPRPAMRATGSSPTSADSEPSSSADAPSLSGEALPAVMVPPWSADRKDGFSPASFSTVESAPDALVAGEVDAGDRSDQVVVEARLPRRVGEQVRADGELVLPLAGDPEPLGEHLVGLAERDRPLRRHPLVDQPPAEGRRDGGDVAGRDRPATAWAAPRVPGSSTRPRRRGRRPRHRTRRCATPAWPRPATSRRAGSPSPPAPRPAARRAAPPSGRRCGCPRRPGWRSPTPRRRSARGPGQGALASTAVTAAAPRSSGRTSASAPPNLPKGVRVAAYRKALSHRCSVPPRTCWAIRKAVLASGTPQ